MLVNVLAKGVTELLEMAPCHCQSHIPVYTKAPQFLIHSDISILEVVFQFQLKVVELIYDGKKPSIVAGFPCCHTANHDKVF